MKTLIAFLGAGEDQLTSLREHLPALLQLADDDNHEWVQVISGLVRKTLFLNGERNLKTGGGGLEFSASVLRKAVVEVLGRADGIIADCGGKEDTDVGAEVRSLCEAPYFSPFEEKFVSRKRQRPKEEFANPHCEGTPELLSKFSEDIASVVSGASNSSPSPSSPSAPVATKTPVIPRAQGGVTKSSGTPLPPATSGPNLAQARRVSLSATDLAAGSDGLRKTSKPLALARNHAGAQSVGVGPIFGNRKSGGSAGVVGGVRAGGVAAGTVKTGVMMINADELQAIHAEKEIAREKAKGKPGRKKAKPSNEEQEAATEENVDGGDGIQQPPQATAGENEGDSRSQEEEAGEKKANASDVMNTTPSAPEKAPPSPEKAAASPEKSPPVGETGGAIPQQGEIEAMAAMMVLGVGGGDKEVVTSFLPEPLTKLLESANSLQPEGKTKLESFFQKKAPAGSPQERIKYHEELSPGPDGDMIRLTSYIRLDYDKWVWDRVHKKKRVKP